MEIPDPDHMIQPEFLDFLNGQPTSYICLFRKITYGTSGDELPPPPLKTEVYALKSKTGENLLDFHMRMSGHGNGVRAALRVLPVPAYSCSQSLDWELAPVLLEDYP